MSEILGEKALSDDIWIRSMGLHKIAKDTIPNLDKETFEVY